MEHMLVALHVLSHDHGLQVFQQASSYYKEMLENSRTCTWVLLPSHCGTRPKKFLRVPNIAIIFLVTISVSQLMMAEIASVAPTWMATDTAQINIL